MAKGKPMTERDPMEDQSAWPLGTSPTLGRSIPKSMAALVLHRDRYGPPEEVLKVEAVATPQLTEADAGRVLVAILASGPNFNTNFAALGLPVPVFGRGDSATLHVPGSDALGIVVDAGAAVTSVKVGEAVILDSWTGNSIRGYETHDGFNCQFAVVDAIRAVRIPPALKRYSPERLAAMLLTYGTAYRAVVERLQVRPGDSLLVMGGGKGTSFAGAQIGKALGARVILVGSNPELGESLIRRGIADRFVDRRAFPREILEVVPPDESFERWHARTAPFREAILAANEGKPVTAIFEHTGGRNFPLLASTLADGGRMAFFGATGQGLRGEYKETFFYGPRRLAMDARWVWMRQKQLVFRSASPDAIFSEIALLPGKRGLIWGADDYALDFARAALARRAELAFIVSRSRDAEGIARLHALGITDAQLIDAARLQFDDDMPDPLADDGTPNPAYNDQYMRQARALGRAIWGVFGPRVSPDFIVERPDQSRLHYSSFVLRDYDEADEMPCACIVMRGDTDLSIRGSHMYRAGQATETVRLLAESRIALEQEDLEVVSLDRLPALQQKMLDGTMTKPKGVALVQADRAGRPIAEYEADFLGKWVQPAAPSAGRFIDCRIVGPVGLVTLTRPEALNALSEELIAQFGQVVNEITEAGTLCGEKIKALIIRGEGRSFVAGADIELFIGKSAAALERLAVDNMAVFTALENLAIPTISLIDGFALGGGNELAMSTRYRIVTENASLGQPEVKLGLIPGYGGMQRLPRLVGPRKAAEMAINGEPVDGRTAVAIGLADEFCPAATALARAWEVANELSPARSESQSASWDELAGGQRDELEALFKEKQVQDLLAAPEPDAGQANDLAAARRFASRIALEALRSGYEVGFEKGLANDARLFGMVTTSPSGQEWSKRFLSKDPLQSSFLQLFDGGAVD